MMGDEEYVFLSMRQALESRGWQVLAGQAARGTTDLPVVQAKLDPGRGSRGAFKPDLVAAIAGSLLVLELKPAFCPADVEKCLALARCDRLINSLLNDLVSRRRWPVGSSGFPNRPNYFLTGVAFQGEEVKQLQQTVCFALSAVDGQWRTSLPSQISLSPDLVRALMI